MSNSETPTTSGQLAQQTEEAPELITESVGILSDAFAHYKNFLLEEEGKDHANCKASTEPIATDHYRRLLEESPEDPGVAPQINLKINKIYLNRLEEIDRLNPKSGSSTCLPLQLRLITFQEWVDYLLQVNGVMFTNLSSLEEETLGKVIPWVESIDGERQQALSENRQLRKDLCAVIKFVQNAFHRNIWDTERLSLETLTVHQVLGVSRDQSYPESESVKVRYRMAECMKSLVNEMAAKHDEVCHLKSQLSSLDEVVQTARQKIIMKDQCIAQLNERLQDITDRLAYVLRPKPLSMTADEEMARVGDLVASCFLNTLAVKDEQECQILKVLDAELNALLEMNSRQEIQSTEACRNRLYKLFKNFSQELVDETTKLENARSHMNALRNKSNNHGSQPNSTPINAVCSEPDGKAVEALRSQLQALTNTHKEVQSNYLRQLNENSDLHSRLASESMVNTRNAEVLKGIADKLIEMGFEGFTYEEIYKTDSTGNPFCAVINKLYVDNRENVISNQHLIEVISGLQETLRHRDGEVSQLQKMIQSYSDFSRNQRLNDEIDRLKEALSAQNQKIREMASLLKNNEDQCENLKTTYDDQCKELKKSKKRQQSLEESACKVESELKSVIIERDLLREEVQALREKDAKATGRERAFCDQLKISEKELNNSRRVIQSLQDQEKQWKQQHRETVKQLDAANATMEQKLRECECEQKKIRGKLKQQEEVNEQQEGIISSFRQWKDAQIRVDEAKRQCEQRAEEQIRMLMEEYRTLVLDYRSLHRDHSLLEAEILRVKKAVHRTTSPSTKPDCARVPPHIGDDQMTNRMRILANTSQRLSIHSQMLNDHSVPQEQARLRKASQKEQERAAALSSQENSSPSRNS
ncbi:golgin subfamily A member 6-like protein 22 isoform X1 [Drosophila pseudoobscura]|uniref:Golgin subfamily A member 6-like protein 22 isoform X1 n=1 Tax=Drosophila pseudoobscura pseudoobscura TaxID=46245 RepID=A0A6I8V9H8_DROPS|nr:golgin subfamily A member 6-like protein 22 isoform X1 [Drosophila pseudoobscura]